MIDVRSRCANDFEESDDKSEVVVDECTSWRCMDLA